MICFDIQIDCNAVECELTYIDGSTASSLSVDCAGSGCLGAHIVCPVGSDSDCTVDCSEGSCSFAKISNAPGGDMNALNVSCNECDYIRIALDPVSISDAAILCHGSVCSL